MAAASGLLACELEAPEFRFGEQIGALEFNLFDETMGIHPSDVVLADPNNPFAETGVGMETRFQILAEGGPVASFYAWATLLATGPNGEAQFYSAESLKGIYDAGLVEEEQRETVRLMAIAAYQSLLDNFPDSVSFTEFNVPFRLVPLSYFQIVDLGGMPRGDWVVVSTPDGVDVVRGSNSLAPPVPEEEEDEEEGS